MFRIEGWETRLDDFIKCRKMQRFEWGKHDCALFSCDAIKEITGEDLAYFFRDLYRTKNEAYAMLTEFGGGGLLEAFEKVSTEFGMEEIKVGFAGRGDVALCNVPTVINEELPTLGIIGMTGKIYIPGTKELQVFEKTIGEKFWKV